MAENDLFSPFSAPIPQRHGMWNGLRAGGDDVSREQLVADMAGMAQKHNFALPYDQMRQSENVTVDPSVDRSTLMNLIYEYMVPSLGNTYTGRATETVELPGSREILKDIEGSGRR